MLLAQRARRELAATGLRPRQAALEGVAALTPRQRQVCELAAAGKGNRAIAQELFLSVKTVETHLAAGYRKLGVNARADLAAQLAELGGAARAAKIRVHDRLSGWRRRPDSRWGCHCVRPLRSMLYPQVVEVARSGAARRVRRRAMARASPL